MVMYNKYDIHNELFLGANVFSILISNKKLLECARELFITQNSLKVKISLSSNSQIKKIGYITCTITYHM